MGGAPGQFRGCSGGRWGLVWRGLGVQGGQHWVQFRGGNGRRIEGCSAAGTGAGLGGLGLGGWGDNAAGKGCQGMGGGVGRGGHWRCRSWRKGGHKCNEGAGNISGCTFGGGGLLAAKIVAPPPPPPHGDGAPRRPLPSALPRSDLRQMLTTKSVENIQFLPFLTTDVKYSGVEPWPARGGWWWGVTWWWGRAEAPRPWHQMLAPFALQQPELAGLRLPEAGLDAHRCQHHRGSPADPLHLGIPLLQPREGGGRPGLMGETGGPLP